MKRRKILALTSEIYLFILFIDMFYKDCQIVQMD